MNTESTKHDPDTTVLPMVSRGSKPERRPIIPIVIGVGALSVIAIGITMVVHAEAKVNKVALGQTAKPVSVMDAQSSTFRGSRDYVGTIEPWVEAKVGPQMISAYVDTVLVRPGAVVKKGTVLATLDCRNASATSHASATSLTLQFAIVHIQPLALLSVDRASNARSRASLPWFDSLDSPAAV